MKQFKLDVPERNILRRVSESTGALLGSCPTSCSTVTVLVNQEIQRQQEAGVTPDILRIVFDATERVLHGSYTYRIRDNDLYCPMKYCTDSYSDMLSVLSVLKQENPSTEYFCETWDSKNEQYIKA